jgi:hypothetical protein
MRAGWDGGLFGAYLKQVGGPVFHAISPDRVFEPASALKVLPHLFAIRSGQNLATTRIPYRTCPRSPLPGDSGMCAGQAVASNICPTNAKASWTYRTSLRTALRRMMQVSDNRETRGVVNHFGRTTINRFANRRGFGARTQIRQVFGCGFSNGLRNDWSLSDAGRLYEGVLNGSLLSAAQQNDFFNLMSTSTGPAAGLTGLVQSEADKQSKGDVVGAFDSQIVVSSKGGSYDVGCLPGSPSSCVFEFYRALAGRITLPYKSSDGTIVSRSFVFGYFVNDLPMPCADHAPGQPALCTASGAADNAFAAMLPEIARAAVRDALSTW